MKSRRILAIEPFFGGSHRQFLESLAANSTHSFDIISQPAVHWKWRMRASPLQVARQVAEHIDRAEALFVSDFVDLATLRGLVPGLERIPNIAYFHENQITYPNRSVHPGDKHFAFTHLSTLACADEIWFNSEWHRQDFLRGYNEILKQYPEPIESHLGRWQDKVKVVYPGIEESQLAEPMPKNTSPVILWNHRWEYDKNPEEFFRTLKRIKPNYEFRLAVAGQSYQNSPSIFSEARQWFEDRIENWGTIKSRQEYLRLLNSADIVVSTALHDFFGISVMEAVRAGCFPVVPDRLAYKELFAKEFKYSEGGFEKALVAALEKCQLKPRSSFSGMAEPYLWHNRIKKIDNYFAQAIEA